MQDIKVKTDFTGYPNDKRQDFAEGQEVQVPVEYADLLVEKGLATKVAKTKAAAKQAASEDKAAE